MYRNEIYPPGWSEERLRSALVQYGLPSIKDPVMGFVNGELTLINPRKPELAVVQALALADTGAVYLCIPPLLAGQLQLQTIDHKEVTLADGSKKRVAYVGPLEVRFKNRVGFMGALVLGDQVLLGAIPMEDMDLVVTPRTRTLDVNSANPDLGGAIIKSVD